MRKRFPNDNYESTSNLERYLGRSPLAKLGQRKQKLFRVTVLIHFVRSINHPVDMCKIRHSSTEIASEVNS